MPRRKRVDTATGALTAFANAAATVQPPAHVILRKCDQPFWDSIVAARSADKWTETDLEHAATLARCKADIERHTVLLEIEGDIVFNAKMTQIVNPRHNILETLSRRAIALSRFLHVHAEATQGKSPRQASGNTATRQAQTVLGDLDDGLIATPNAVGGVH